MQASVRPVMPHRVAKPFPQALAIFAIAIALALCAAILGSVKPAGAQFGCCQFVGGICTTTAQANACVANAGTFFSDRTCRGGTLCIRLRPQPAPRVSLPSSERPGRAPSLIQPRPPKIVVPHGPRATFAPLVTATPTATATATPVPNALGCCQLRDGFADVCASRIDAGACLNERGTFVSDGICNNFTGQCQRFGVPPPSTGCCQFNGARPGCFESTFTQCVRTGGSFATGNRCNAAGVFCEPSPIAICGNGVIEPGEECERDSHCAQPVEGCTAQCHCAGGIEVWLRWTNYNDVDLTVIDPLGNVYVPHHNVNRECNDETRAPEESIFLPPGRAPIGCYRVEAHYAERCPRSGIVDTHLQVRLNVAGFKWIFQDVPGPRPGQTFTTQFGFRQSCP